MHGIGSASSARKAQLEYVSDEGPGFQRSRKGKGFHFLDCHGRPCTPHDVARITALAIPPAWTSVWICPHARGHIQATGRDQRGRKQYRYHARWREVRDTLKYGKLIEFAEVLPRVRAAVEKALRRPLGRETLLAAVVRLLERTQIRIGNDEYAKQNGSFGLTTLRDRHVRVTGNVVHFKFRGKSRVKREVDLCDRRLARIIRQCLKLPGHELFHYLESDGHMRRVSSDDVNEFLSQLAGRRLTAKEFRTWTGTVLAARTLAQMSHGSAAEAKRNICAAVKTVAAQLGNTPAVCRRSYIHPAVLEAYEHDELRRAMSKIRPVSDHGAGLDADERAVRDLLVHASAPARRHAA